MSATVHRLKTIDRYFDAVADGRKTFEVRRNDRAFQTGDLLDLLKITDAGLVVYDGPERNAKPMLLRKRITYLLQGGQFGIESGFCVLGLGEP